jgi:ElaB/YqjD/DUF883 family membrane-anchored ribosome-binding protein
MANPITKGKEGNSIGSSMEKARETASQVTDKAKDLGSQAMDKAKDFGSQVADKAKGVAHSVGEAVSGAASTVGKKADDLTATAGTGIKNLGETLSHKAPHEGMLGNASQAVASTIKDSGRYIEEAGLSGMAEDLTNLVRRNPIPALFVGMGLGFLLGRVMRS